MDVFHVGTEGFMAPEVVLGRLYDNSADFFSLGVLGYLLTSQGRRPWENMFSALEAGAVDYSLMRSCERDFVAGLLRLVLVIVFVML